jgi:hypothetical protein
MAISPTPHAFARQIAFRHAAALLPRHGDIVAFRINDQQFWTAAVEHAMIADHERRIIWRRRRQDQHQIASVKLFAFHLYVLIYTSQ